MSLVLFSWKWEIRLLFDLAVSFQTWVMTSLRLWKERVQRTQLMAGGRETIQWFKPQDIFRSQARFYLLLQAFHNKFMKLNLKHFHHLSLLRLQPLLNLHRAHLAAGDTDFSKCPKSFEPTIVTAQKISSKWEHTHARVLATQGNKELFYTTSSAWKTK